MNPRERFLRAIRRLSVDKIPKHAFWTPEVMEKVKDIKPMIAYPKNVKDNLEEYEKERE